MEAKQKLHRLVRYRNRVPTVCPYCLLNPSMGRTTWGVLGCVSCQAKVDEFIEKHFEIVQGDFTKRILELLESKQERRS